jgi:hypothetical protein
MREWAEAMAGSPEGQDFSAMARLGLATSSPKRGQRFMAGLFENAFFLPQSEQNLAMLGG